MKNKTITKKLDRVPRLEVFKNITNKSWINSNFVLILIFKCVYIKVWYNFIIYYDIYLIIIVLIIIIINITDIRNYILLKE